MNDLQKSQQPVAPAKPVELLKAVLKADSVKEQFQNALGKHKDAFVASLIDLYTGDKSLQTCKPQLVVMEALRAATLQLPLNKALGFAYIVVYNNNVKTIDPATGRDVWTKVPTPTFILGWRGINQLAMRSGQYENINADFVYEGELLGFDKLSGKINLSGERKSDKIVGYFCYYKLVNGFTKTLYMSVEEMAAYALRYSPSIKKGTTVEQLIAKANDGVVSKQVGWMGNFNDMALKTVTRRLIGKWGILSVELQGMSEALARENEIEESAASRNDMIEEGANKQTLELDTIEYEEVVDETTGEVTSEPKVAPASPEDDTPGY